MSGAMLVQLTAEELRAMIADAVRAAVPQPDSPHRMLSVAKLAEVLDSSPSSVRRMMADGCPHVRIGDAPRFVLADVLGWLRDRTAGNVVPLRKRGA